MSGWTLEDGPSSPPPDAPPNPALDGRAACKDADTDLFFPEGGGYPARWKMERAVAICERCPITAACLEYAIKVDIEYGVWGAKTPDERRGLGSRMLRRCARPQCDELVIGNAAKRYCSSNCQSLHWYHNNYAGRRKEFET